MILAPSRQSAETSAQRGPSFAPVLAVAFALAAMDPADSRTAAAPTATAAVSVAAASMPTIAQLMAPGPLPDLPQGAADATVTIIEYGSTTCTHCAAFHDNVFPSLKARYIDAGKVIFIFREFPLDPLAAGSFMLARCAGPDKRDAIIDQLFTRQKDWAFAAKPIAALFDLVKRSGMSQVDFDNCLNNQELLDRVRQTRDLAAAKFNVEATPTFFVNGRKMTGDLPIAEFDKVLAPLLK